MIMTTQKHHCITVKKQCAYHGIPYKQAFRWCTLRISNPQIKKGPLALTGIEEIADDEQRDKVLDAYLKLQHVQQRTHGSGAFHECLESIASRRQIQEFITAERKEHSKEEKSCLTRVSWNAPRTCWAMDDTHLFTEPDGTKIWIHNIKDLGSQYILPPVTGPIMSGKEVAENLKNLFDRFGAPLILKRDNGSNLCAEEVNNVLKKYKVIALTSPTYYSQYNGSIEQANGLMKKRIAMLCEKYDVKVNRKSAPVLADLAAHEENNRVKRSAKRRTPSFRFFGKNRKAVNKMRKEVIYEIIEERKVLTDGKMHLTKNEEKQISRKAVEAIFEKRGYTTVVEPE